MIGTNIRFGKGCMDSCRANFDGHGGVKGSDGHLERLETDGFIGKDAKLS